MRWIASVLEDQWEALQREWPVRPGTTREQFATYGIFVVASLALLMAEDGAIGMWSLFGIDFAGGGVDVKYWRRLGWVVGTTILYVAPTALYARAVLGLRARDLGLTLDGFLEHLPLYVMFFGVVAPCVVLVSFTEDFQNTYPLSRFASRKLEWLLLWELCYGIQFVAVEFLFRGFLVLAPARRIGPWAIPAMLVPYCMLHFDKPWPEAVGALIAGTVLGAVALRTRSIVAGIAIHASVAWFMDLASLAQQGAFPRLLGTG